MSLDTERAAIETYLSNNWTDTSIGFDGWPFTPTADSVQLSITDGAVMQQSIGRTQNLFVNVGVATLTIYTDAAQGSASWRGYAQSIKTLFHGKTLDADGAIVTSGAQTPLVRFSPPELGDNRHPYNGASFVDAPFRRTNIICPFVCYELR
jgi:hypothetical protein